MIVYLQRRGKHYIADLDADLSSDWCNSYDEAYEKLHTLHRPVSKYFGILHSCKTEADILLHFADDYPQFISLAPTAYEYW